MDERQKMLGDAEILPAFQREMRPFIAVQVCVKEKWVTCHEYRVPLAENPGKELECLQEIAMDLVEEAYEDAKE